MIHTTPLTHRNFLTNIMFTTVPRLVVRQKSCDQNKFLLLFFFFFFVERTRSSDSYNNSMFSCRWTTRISVCGCLESLRSPRYRIYEHPRETLCFRSSILCNFNCKGGNSRVLRSYMVDIIAKLEGKRYTSKHL